MATYVLTVDGSGPAMTALADALFDDVVLPVDAAGAFDLGNGTWRLEAYLHDRPEDDILQERLGDLLAETGVGEDEARQGLATVTLRPLDKGDWQETGLDQLPPIVADRFRIFGEHNCPAQLERNDALIEASTAFGTGDHASTYLSLMHLSAILKARRPVNVLDVGTGTGILGIALARAVPSARVLASDIDARSCEMAALNARQNGVAAQIRVLHRAGLDAVDFARAAPFDLVLANILPDPLTALAPRIAALTAPGGALVVAGLRIGQISRLVSAYGQRGFRLTATLTAKEWASLRFEKIGRGKKTGRTPLYRGM
jgi:ribosomal protein L11 methyltransferase